VDVGAEQERPAEVTRPGTHQSAAQVAVDTLTAAAARVGQSYLSLADGWAALCAQLEEERRRRRTAERDAAQLADELTRIRDLIRRLQTAAPAFAELERDLLAELENGRERPAQEQTARPWERMALGLCPGCSRTVFSGDQFNLHRQSWGADFVGDQPGERLVFTHRKCGNGDHSKDGV